MSPIAQVELAMVERLRSVERLYSGLTIESYAAQLDDSLFQWVRTLPATWVTFDQVTESKRVGKRSFLVTAAFEVLVAQRALNENERRHGGAALARDIGVYQLLEDNKLALANQALGLAIQPITPGAIRSVMKGEAERDSVAIYAQAFRTQWMEVIPEQDAVPDGELVTIGLNYLLKPGDDVVDSTDLITTRTP